MIGLAKASLWNVQAAVGITQNLGANWVGSPTVMVANNPSTTLNSTESNWGSSAPYSLGQSFTVPVSGALTNIQLYVTGKNTTNILYLYDMGPAMQYQVNQPSVITPGSNGISGNLFSTNLAIAVPTTANASVMQLTFSGADAVQLIGGHQYYFVMVSLTSSAMWWHRSGGGADVYSGGIAYRQNSKFNGGTITDFSLAVSLINTSAPPPIYNCVVDWTNTYQRIDGFGASSAWKSTWTAAQADMFFGTNSGTGTTITGGTNFAFNGIGLSLLRTRVNTNGTGTYENSIMQMAQTRGARVWSTPWSPPPQFKSNGNVNGGTFLSASNQAYANVLAQYVVNMQNSYGVSIYALSVQNEPDLATSYESCVWTGQQIHDFVPYLRNALNAAGKSSVKIIAAEDQHWGTNLYAAALSDPAVATNVNIIACHNYDNSPPSGIPAALPRYANPDAVLWETEVSKLAGNGAFDPSMTDAIYWAGRLHLFMTTANVSAWHYWWLVSNNPDNEGLTDQSGIPAKRMYVLGQYSRFVRPDNYRIEMANYNPYAVLGSAYKDPVSGNFAIVIANTNSAATTQSFYFTNFTATTVTPWITSSNLSLAAQAPVAVTGSTFSYTIPGMSVVTFVGVKTSGPTPPMISSMPTASSIIYGQTLGSSILNGGAVTNAAGASVAGTFAFTAPSTIPGAGTPSVSVTFTPTDTNNYTTATTSIYMTVHRQTPAISILPTASTITYGQTLTNSTLIGGSASNTAGAVVNGSFAFTTPSAKPGAGTSGVPVTFTPSDLVNYLAATTSAQISVSAPTITVAANNQSKTAGLPNPPLSASYSGFVNGEDTNVLSTLATLTTPATNSSPAGSYAITPAGATAANYSFNFVPGTLTVVAPPQLSDVNITAAGVEIAFPTLEGQLYQLLVKTNLTDADWTPVGSPIPGTGSPMNVTNNTSAPQGFYLLRILQP